MQDWKAKDSEIKGVVQSDIVETCKEIAHQSTTGEPTERTEVPDELETVNVTTLNSFGILEGGTAEEAQGKAQGTIHDPQGLHLYHDLYNMEHGLINPLNRKR